MNKTIFIIIVGILNVICTMSLLADINAPFPIEKIEEKLISDKSKKIPALVNSMKYFRDKKYQATLKEISRLENNSEFKDYYYFILGKANMALMLEYSKKGAVNLVQKHGEAAILSFRQVATSYAYSPLEKRSMIYLARAELELAKVNLKKRQKAREYFESGFQHYNEYGLLVLVPRHFMSNYAQICDKKSDELCTSWELKLSAVLPKSDRQKIFPRIDGMTFPNAEKTTTVPYKVDLDLQQFQLGFDNYLQKKYEEAYSIWYELIKTYPKTSIKLRTKFWMGRASQLLAQDSRAETLYREVIQEIPFSYYALLSSWYSGIDVFRNIDAQLPLAISGVQLINPADHVHVHRAEIFLANKIPELARLELREVKPRDQMPNEFLVYLAGLSHLAHNYVTGFQYISELGYRNYTGFYSSYGERMIFPTIENKFIEKYSKQYGLDPLLVTSLMKQESAFNSEAMSTSNAFGFMQIITPTARDLDPDLEAEELFDEEKNISLGTKYIRQLQKKNNGDIIYTLAGYNAGPGNADRWKILANEKAPLLPEEAIELINFRETHDYVQNILRNYYWYKRRANGEGFVNLTALLQSLR